MARVHIRLMSITIVFIALRLLKVGRVINEMFGILVMTLQYVIYDILVWLSVYVLFLLPYGNSDLLLLNSRLMLIRKLISL
jgi:hypothetical protein